MGGGAMTVCVVVVVVVVAEEVVQDTRYKKGKERRGKYWFIQM